MDVVAVLARWPRPGRVKTRLSPALPETLACDLHRAMLEDTLAAARASRARRRILCWADAPPEEDASAEGFEIAHQPEADLGARLQWAFDAWLPPNARVVVTGSDAPELTASHLDHAFEALGTHDLALGPTPDGGFHLVGLSRTVAGLFDDHPWSTPDARGSVETRARALGLKVAVLAAVADVDTPGDLVALIARLLGSKGAPATAAALEAIGLFRRPA